jgi:tRNA (guanine-N7-)-methyltransferase
MGENKKSVIVCPRSYVEPLPMRELFSKQQPLEIELGAGDGSFLVAWAAKKPLHNFLGVERLLGRLRKTDRKIQRAGLANSRLLRIEAGYFLEYLVPLASATALHIYFPDPWPKRKHWRHRLINDQFTRVAAKALQPGGTVYLRTDDQSYFAQMTSVFGANPDYGMTSTPAELRAVLTDFERDFQARGVSTLMAAYRKR